ncbi:MAG TPA: pectin acetylesterase-family hydrolase, partial [Polyangiaceae bacterium]|nr:pectin acetylesterase-family hydrolase [Polyangiaceae bacterium]
MANTTPLRWLSIVAATVMVAGCGPELGAPIQVAPQDLEKWVWVPVPEMRCSDNSPAGLVVNFTNQSRDLVIFFQGGGACWNDPICALQRAELAPMGPDPLATFRADPEHAQSGIFDRGDASNPWRRSNFVFIPYCTGDGHIGNKVAPYGVHHVGYANVTAAIKRIVPTFRDAPNIVVAGFSAGGIGASGNYHQIASAFESVRSGPIALINDAGPSLRMPYLNEAAQRTLADAWGADRTVGSWCPECMTEGSHYEDRKSAELHPGMRGALICAYDDGIVQVMYQALLSPIGGGQIKQGLLDLASWRTSVASNVAPSVLREFYYPGGRHGAIATTPL